MTQKDLAKASGMSVPQIARYETGTSRPRMTALVKLAKALNVEVSELEEAGDEPETVELALLTIGTNESTPFTLPKSIVDELREDAETRGVTLEVILASTMRFALTMSSGEPKSFDEIVAEVSAQYKKFPPL
jgi:transcriptional regulator with XRE-family HTH domain